MISGRLLGYVLAALAVADAVAAASTPTVTAREHKNKGDEPSPVASAVLGGQTFVNKVRGSVMGWMID
jgi:hypothetical protein